MLLRSKEKQPFFTLNRMEGLLWLVCSKQAVTVHYRLFVATRTWSFEVMMTYYEAFQKPTKLLCVKQHSSILIYFLHKQNHGVDTTGAMMRAYRMQLCHFLDIIKFDPFSELYSWEFWQLGFDRIKSWNKRWMKLEAVLGMIIHATLVICGWHTVSVRPLAARVSDRLVSHRKLRLTPYVQEVSTHRLNLVQLILHFLSIWNPYL